MCEYVMGTMYANRNSLPAYLLPNIPIRPLFEEVVKQ